MFEPPVQRLIDEFARLPGIGRKSAQRLTFHILNIEDVDASRLSDAILDMKKKIRLCAQCFNLTAEELCSVCADLRRDPTVLCVVERAQDIAVIEGTNQFRGRYHVLGGSISPIEGIGPDELRIRELLGRLDHEGVTEVIVATNPTVEGDMTAMYIARAIKPLGITVSRLASGLPVGGDLDYADEVTLGRALSGRQEM
ncbi:MAG: recombination protein RecR [Actinobacteria bacterium]|uniref:Recombination protein RecR n=1 Tax=hydrothermal vent metagenome TaxID=652676 RepID=A0A3B0S4B2_9ZZZZ|nr:recombination protein RecR [Actinomycetota bacterium]